MKQCIFAVCLAGALVPFAGAAPDLQGLPPEVAGFYRDYNWVCTATTPSERNKLTTQKQRELSTNRLSLIRQLMTKLEGQLLEERGFRGLAYIGVMEPEEIDLSATNRLVVKVRVFPQERVRQVQPPPPGNLPAPAEGSYLEYHFWKRSGSGPWLRERYTEVLTKTP